MPVRIFLVDDHQIVRQGLRLLLEKQPDFRVVGDAGDGRSAIEAIGRAKPDVVIMDIALPDLNGIDVIRRILADAPGLKVTALSMHAEKDFVLDALRAGAVGYLLKESAYEELVSAIRLVLSGQTYLSQKIADLVIKDYVRHLPELNDRKSSHLSDREREVWQLVAEGHANQDIADTLCLSVRTVEYHRKRLMEKLDVHSVADLVKLAIREGLVSLE